MVPKGRLRKMGSSSSIQSQEIDLKDSNLTQNEADEPAEENNNDEKAEECFLEANVSESKFHNNNDKEAIKKRESVLIADQSIDVQDFIIAMKVNYHYSLANDVPQLEISDMTPNEIIKQKEDRKLNIELEKLAVAQRKREEEIYKEERLISLRNQLDGRYSILERYREDQMEISQSVIDNLSCLVTKFYNCMKYEQYIPTLEKRHPALEKKLQRRKQQKENLQTKHVKATPSRLKQTNPDIAELSSATRAKKLASQLTALYNQERKACFTEVRQRTPRGTPDSGIHMCLRDIFLYCYNRCRTMMDFQTQSISSCLTLRQTPTLLCTYRKPGSYIDEINALACSLLVKEFQKNVSKWCTTRLKKETLQEISKIQEFDLVTKTLRATPYHPPLNHFLDRSIEMSWSSLLHIPALSIVNNRESKYRSMYRPLSKDGSNISYVIWPAMTESGSVLVKGVATFDNKVTHDIQQRKPRIVSS